MADRTYIHNKFHGPQVLVTWCQRRCVRCQRYLGKREMKYCDRCRSEVNYPYKKYWEHRYLDCPEVKEEYRLRAKVHRNADRFNIGDII